MRTRDDLEAYLSASSYRHEQVADDTWVVSDPSSEGGKVVVRIEDGWVIFRLKVMALSEGVKREALFEKLLSLNASDLSQVAYALMDGEVVLTSAHRLETLDLEELQGTLDEFSLVVATHHNMLQSFSA